MTKAVCMNCGELKLGAYIPCPHCKFSPRTLLDLTMSELYSDRCSDEEGLRKLAATIKNNQKVAQYLTGTLEIDASIYSLIEQRLANQTFRDMLTLVRKAKDGIFRKELNMHLIGSDGYQSLVRLRGKDIDKESFDKIRSEGDGDLYVSYHYDGGNRKISAVSKRDWYILYDKMQIVERQALGQSPYLNLLDKIFDSLLDNYLKHGVLVPPLNEAQPSSRSTRPAKIHENSSLLSDVDIGSTDSSLLSDGQDKFALEIESLSSIEASDAYGALVSIVHQLVRMKSGLGVPVALDDTEIFVKSFESYIDSLDEIDAKDLSMDYETVRQSIFAMSTHLNVRHGAKAFMVIVLGEMIRREGASNGKHEMSGYKRARRMLDYLEKSLSNG